MSLDIWSAPIQFKHKFDGQKKKVDGQLLIKQHTVECDFQSKSLKVIPFTNLTGTEYNENNMKLRLLIGDKKLLVTFTGPQAMDNRTLAARLLEKELKKLRQESRKPTQDLAKRRAKILSRDAELRLAFNRLVKKDKVIGYEDFWRDYEKLNPKTVSEKEGLDNISNFNSIQNTTEKFQVHKLFDSMKRKGNMVSLSVSEKDRHLIFLNMPHVRRAYLHEVPSQMSDVEFWKRFLQTEYFRQDKYTVSAADNEVDRLFRSYLLKNDEPARKKRKLNPAVDLTSADRVDANHTQIEEPLKGKSAKDWLEKVNSNSEALVDILPSPGEDGYRDRLQEETNLKHLSSDHNKTQFLPLKNIQHTFGDKKKLSKSMQGKMQQACKWLKQELITQRCNRIQNGKEQPNRQIWNKLNRSMRTVNEPNPHRMRNIMQRKAEWERKLIETHFIVSELLRHFWNCFPLTKASAVRLQKLEPKLTGFRQAVTKKLREAERTGYMVKNWQSLASMLEKAERKKQQLRRLG